MAGRTFEASRPDLPLSSRRREKDNTHGLPLLPLNVFLWVDDTVAWQYIRCGARLDQGQPRMWHSFGQLSGLHIGQRRGAAVRPLETRSV